MREDVALFPGPWSVVEGDEQLPQRVEGLQAPARTDRHALQRHGDRVHRHHGLVGQPASQPAQEGPTADEVDALGDDVLCKLGRSSAQAVAPPPR